MLLLTRPMLYLIKPASKISKALRGSLNTFLLETNIYYTLVPRAGLDKSGNLYNDSKLIKARPF